MPDGLEDSTWGGVVSDSSVLCHHRHPPRRRYTWEGSHIGRRFLGCPLKVPLVLQSILLQSFVLGIILLMLKHLVFGLLCLVDALCRKKSMRCAFVQWIDEEWPPRAQ